MVHIIGKQKASQTPSGGTALGGTALGGTAKGTGKSGPSWQIEGSDQAFAADVLEASFDQPVVVQFHATWCEPCKQLAPRLEKQLAAFKGGIRLVRIDIDQNPMVATQMRVQSVPMVVVFFEGRPVDGFMGNVTDAQLSGLIKKIAQFANIPEATEDEAQAAALDRAEEAFITGDIGAAYADFSDLWRKGYEPVRTLSGLVRVLLCQSRPEDARQAYDGAADALRKDPAIQRLGAMIDAFVDLQGDVASANDQGSALGACRSRMVAGEFPAAVECLLGVLADARKDGDTDLFDKGRHLLVMIFDVLDTSHPATKQGRRRLSSLLFS